MNNERPSWDEYFMKLAEDVSTRSTCRRHVGAVITKNNVIVSTGYNGSPKGLTHCSENGGCIREKNNVPSGTMQEFCRAVHAEQNAIIQAAVNGTSIKGGTIYINTYPCSICTRMLINAEIKRIVYNSDYSDELSKKMLDESGIEVVKF
ncbi:MAG TPA: cytidine/deoxycytidylate deaminase family protein [Bacilli bacterium]|nr:cytidine/deoxycytidylate deaminase family protein [Bacilli bacterium]